MKPLRPLAALAVLLLAACSAPATPSSSSASPAAATPPALGTNGAAVPALKWAPCHGTFQCASAQVPLSYREPTGPAISLAVIKLPASDPGRRLGSLFFNFGGPGTDGVSELIRFGARYPDELRARFDLVSFDPRGIGGSAPISCPGADKVPAGGSPLRPEQHDAFYAASAAPGKACAAGSGDLLNHLSTANVARDMDLLRQGVGDQSLNFYGYSYGTYLGGTYANLFPDKTRALTLDGTLDLVANATGKPGQEHAPVDVRADVAGSQQQELDKFFDECAAAGPKCAFSAGDPRQKFADIYAKLSQGPVGGTTLASLLKTIDSAEYQSGRWKRLAETLNALAGPAEGAAPAAVLDPYLPTHSPGFLAVQCSDSDNPKTPAEYDELAKTERVRQPYFGLGAVFAMAQCVGWPGHDEDRYRGPWNRPRANPVLVLNNRYDPATPLHNAQATAGEPGDGHVLVVDGFGHTSLNVHSACASAAVADYFTTLKTPADGATCAPDTVPFP
ncbi:alpha/beta hydrolase [Amycolatopsis sp. H20-H5]|uniref:alpha/beta hydrolase n=1 Tax=Amycolatopsis sp. H20-H5 TaxID=3046309 RepID=UPI002DB99071|nr:alpha/beta hydrolase [Amycolatopsis sp. H20-H5]MEC3982452.1 alpha/beta hydrolase [Amycolatopsis sp. H20-H5]